MMLKNCEECLNFKSDEDKRLFLFYYNVNELMGELGNAERDNGCLHFKKESALYKAFSNFKNFYHMVNPQCSYCMVFDSDSSFFAFSDAGRYGAITNGDTVLEEMFADGCFSSVPFSKNVSDIEPYLRSLILKQWREYGTTGYYVDKNS